MAFPIDKPDPIDSLYEDYLSVFGEYCKITDFSGEMFIRPNPERKLKEQVVTIPHEKVRVGDIFSLSLVGKWLKVYRFRTIKFCLKKVKADPNVDQYTLRV